MFNQVQESLAIGAVDVDISDLLSECGDDGYLSDVEEEVNSINIDISNGPPIDLQNFKIVHYNINSILAHDRISQLTAVCQTLKIDVLIISESKLDQTIPSSLITIPGYHEPLRHDRSINGRHGGGVLMYISENLAFQQKHEFESELFEHIWADIRINGKIFAINGLYRPPNEDAENHNLFLETAEKVLLQLNNYNRADYKLLSGDFNFGNIYCKSTVLQPKPLDVKASDLFSSHGFHQLIDIPTRFAENTVVHFCKKEISYSVKTNEKRKVFKYTPSSRK